MTVGRYSEETVVWPCWAIKYVDMLDAWEAKKAEEGQWVSCFECKEAAEHNSFCDQADDVRATHFVRKAKTILEARNPKEQ